MDPPIRQPPINTTLALSFLIPMKRNTIPEISIIAAKQTIIKTIISNVISLNSSISYIIFKFSPVFTTTHHKSVVKDII